MAWYATEMTSLAAEKLQLNQEIEVLSTQLAEIEADIVKFIGKEGREGKYMRTLTILVDAQEFSPSGDCPERPPLLLTYIVSNASWTPSYDVRINSEKNSLQLVYFAEVKQSSGEDWIDVDLTLSTANPASGATPTPLRNVVVQQHYDMYVERMSKGGFMSKKASKASTNFQPQSYIMNGNNYRNQVEVCMKCLEVVRAECYAGRYLSRAVHISHPF